MQSAIGRNTDNELVDGGVGVSYSAVSKPIGREVREMRKAMYMRLGNKLTAIVYDPERGKGHMLIRRYVLHEFGTLKQGRAFDARINRFWSMTDGEV